ncbi:MAG: TetR/AcrR family transcriptional regulator [Terriglobus sp.]
MSYPTKTDRESILAAAIAEVESGDSEHLAIRSVAGRLGLAPNALYHYFDNLAALEEAVSESVRLQILEGMQKVAGKKGPAETLLAISWTYLQFAIEHPRLFSYTLKPSITGRQTLQCARSSEFFFRQVVRLYGEKRASVATQSILAYLRGLAASRHAEMLSYEQIRSSFKFGMQIWIADAQASPKKSN